MKTTNKASKTVDISITTFDMGDETIRFLSDGSRVKVKEHGQAARDIDLEEAVAWMTRLSLAKYGVTTETQKMPAWAV